MGIYLVRHGQSEFNSSHQDGGKRESVPLAVVGHGDSFRELAGFTMANSEIRLYPG